MLSTQIEKNTFFGIKEENEENNQTTIEIMEKRMNMVITPDLEMYEKIKGKR